MKGMRILELFWDEDPRAMKGMRILELFLDEDPRAMKLGTRNTAYGVGLQPTSRVPKLCWFLYLSPKLGCC